MQRKEKTMTLTGNQIIALVFALAATAHIVVAVLP